MLSSNSVKSRKVSFLDLISKLIKRLTVLILQHMKSCQIHKNVKNMTKAAGDTDSRKELAPPISTLISMISLNNSKTIFSGTIWTSISSPISLVILVITTKPVEEPLALMICSMMKTFLALEGTGSWMSVLEAQANNIVKLLRSGSTIW